jgi:hypothetical protein
MYNIFPPIYEYSKHTKPYFLVTILVGGFDIFVEVEMECRNHDFAVALSFP